MKKIFAILSIFIFCICSISPINAHANQPLEETISPQRNRTIITVKVLDKDTGEALIGTTISVMQGEELIQDLSGQTDTDGNFNITINRDRLGVICRDNGNKFTIKISYVGYEDVKKDINCSEIIDKPKYNMETVRLKSIHLELSDVEVVNDLCHTDLLEKLHAKTIQKRSDRNGDYCLITCDETMERIEIPDNGDAKREELGFYPNAKHIRYFCECGPKPEGATEYEYDEANKYCYVTECDEPRYQLKRNDDQKRNSCDEKVCEIPHGVGKWEWDDREGEWKCTVKRCNSGFIRDPEEKEDTSKMCISKDCKDTIREGNAAQVTSAEWVEVDGRLKCEVQDCKDGYQPNDAKTNCEENKCTPDATERLIEAGAKTVKFDRNKGKCIIKECQCGYDYENEDSCRKWGTNESCETTIKIQLPKNAISGIKACDNKKKYCQIKECKPHYNLEDANTPDNECVSTEGDPCSTADIEAIKHAKKGKYRIDSNNQKYCHVTKCDDNYEPSDDGRECVQNECTPEDKRAHPDASRTKYEEVNGAKICIATECYCGYNLRDHKCIQWVDGEECNSTTEPKLPKNAKKGVKKCTDAQKRKNQKAYCDISECNDYYKEEEESVDTKDNKCVSTKGDSCLDEIKTKQPLAEEAEYKIDKNNVRKCVITKCKTVTDEKNNKKQKKVYVPNDAGTACVQSKGECDIDPTVHPGATEGKIKKGKCVPSKCKKGYELKKDECIEKKILSKKDSEDQIAELEENAKKLKENEQSKGNRMLSGASMGATGIGGMQLASALSEQQADENAEDAMRAYLATFHCNYGDGKNIPGGTSNVELPGGNELINLYTEYVTLANDLKMRKTALDMRPGIESQAILDGATSGLYDDVSMGKTSGAFASLARALQDPNGPDAQAWAKQKSSTKSKLTTGAVIAGVGAVGGLVGDLIINKDAPKNQAKDIISKYESKKGSASKLLADLVAQMPVTPGTNNPDCPDDAEPAGETCICSGDKVYYKIKKICDKCPDDAQKKDDTCKCDNPNEGFNTDTGKCYTCDQENFVPNNNYCEECPKHSTEDGNTCKCDDEIEQEFDPINWSCKCKERNKTIDANGKCVASQQTAAEDETNEPTETEDETNEPTEAESPTSEEPATIIPASHLFDLGSAKLEQTGEELLSRWINDITSTPPQTCVITITGYADPTGSIDYNNKLSGKRAAAAKSYLERYINEANIEGDFDIQAKEGGETNCNCKLTERLDASLKDHPDYELCKNHWGENHPIERGDNNDINMPFPPCRRIEITAGEYCIKKEDNNTTN